MLGTKGAAIGQDLRRLFDGGSAVGLTDAQLVDRAAHRDGTTQAAFEALLTRHGPSVLACCRRVLGEPAASEDAFQAAFLVLFRRAGSIRVGQLLAPWLMDVARLTALKAWESELRRAQDHRAARPEAEADEVMAFDLRLLVPPRSTACRRITGTRSTFATSRVGLMTTRQRPWAGRSERSADVWRGHGTCCGCG